jgi:hypothetical protein
MPDHSSTTHTISRHTLELSFELLRSQRPALALLVQNILSTQRHPAGNLPSSDMIKPKLAEHQVAEIVESLAEIGQRASKTLDYEREQLIEIRCVLMDWIIYAQGFMSMPDSITGLDQADD